MSTEGVTARISSTRPREQPLAGPRDRLPGAVHGRARRDDRERRAALDPARAALLALEPAVGGQRLHADVRRLPAARRPGGRPARAQATVRRRASRCSRRASLLNGVAQSPTMLIAGRGLQGLGGALRVPRRAVDHHHHVHATPTSAPGRSACGARSPPAAAPSACCSAACSPTSSRGRGSSSSTSRSGSPRCSRRSATCPSRAPISRTEPSTSRGASTVTAGLVVIVFAIVKAQAWGWGSAAHDRPARPSAWPCWRRSCASSAAARRRWCGSSIFRIRTLAVADVVLLLVASGMFGMFFFASLYVQEILGYSPLQAGLAFLPVTAGIVIGAGIAQQLVARLGVRNVAWSGSRSPRRDGACSRSCRSTAATPATC